jgi:hypothetical protein
MEASCSSVGASRPSCASMNILPQSRHLLVRWALVATCAAAIASGCTGSSAPSPSTDLIDTTVLPTDSAQPGDSSIAISATSGVAPSSRTGGPITIRVPTDQPTVQAAVDTAAPGDLVLVAAGVYSEAVIVRTPSIVIRGEDRNTVIFDGNDELVNGFQVSADGVAIENMTVRRYQVNGIVFTNAYDAADPNQAKVLLGYRASYVTVANNGLYGLYAFYAAGGQFDHVYGSGHPDGGIYIGQCKPCNALVSDAVMELNGLGYSGTNASDGVFVINSVFRRNRIGLSPNSQNMERLAPQGDIVIAGNLVEDNDDPQAPPAASGAFGFGIAVGGGERNQIVRNRVRGNANVGIAITTLETFLPAGNRVEGNVMTDNGTDLAFYSAAGAELSSEKNCFGGNTFSTSAPINIESELSCDADVHTVAVDGSGFQQEGPPGADYRLIPLPTAQTVMPDPLTAPPVPAAATVPTVDLASIKVPE